MKNILQGIGIVFTLIASFLGLMYILKGDVLISSVVSLVIIVIEYFLIEKFIKSKTEITKNKYSTLSVVLWSVYLILTIPVSIFLFHALNVEINAKNEIQKIANIKLADLSNMVKTYRSKVDQNLTTLSIDLHIKLTQYDAAKSATIEMELKSSPFKLSDTEISSVHSGNIDNVVKNFLIAKSIKLLSIADTIDRDNSKFIKRYGGVFDGWSRLHINYAFYELDNLLKSNNEKFIAVDSQQMAFTPTRYNFSYSIEDSNMDKPLVLFNKYKPYYLILVVMLFHFLILLPYFIEETRGVYKPKSEKMKTTKKGGGLKI